ncbi:hypothetical protein [Thalassiella azotivora]
MERHLCQLHSQRHGVFAGYKMHASIRERAARSVLDETSPTKRIPLSLGKRRYICGRRYEQGKLGLRQAGGDISIRRLSRKATCQQRGIHVLTNGGRLGPCGTVQEAEVTRCALGAGHMVNIDEGVRTL